VVPEPVTVAVCPAILMIGVWTASDVVMETVITSPTLAKLGLEFEVVTVVELKVGAV